MSGARDLWHLVYVVQAIYVVQKTRSAVLLADMEAPSTITVRLINYTPSELHIRQLKSSTIGVCRSLTINIETEQRSDELRTPTCTWAVLCSCAWSGCLLGCARLC